MYRPSGDQAGARFWKPADDGVRFTSGGSGAPTLLASQRSISGIGNVVRDGTSEVGSVSGRDATTQRSSGEIAGSKPVVTFTEVADTSTATLKHSIGAEPTGFCALRPTKVSP